MAITIKSAEEAVQVDNFNRCLRVLCDVVETRLPADFAPALTVFEWQRLALALQNPLTEGIKGWRDNLWADFRAGESAAFLEGFHALVALATTGDLPNWLDHNTPVGLSPLLSPEDRPADDAADRLCELWSVTVKLLAAFGLEIRPTDL